MNSNNLHSLSIEQKIGQLFFVGLPSSQIDSNTRNLLEEISPGGVCLFARNIREAHQTKEYLVEIKQVLPIIPFLSIDQEGGLVDRLRRLITPMPSVKSLRNLDDAKKLATITARVLSILGFNMNFAPVIDIIDSDRTQLNNGLYSRVYGDSKDDVAKFGNLYLSELQNSGIIGCLKHFPGLGSTKIDSHEELPVVETAKAELFDKDLFPYKHILEKQNVAAIMVAHACFPKLDLQETDQSGKLLPSSLSFNFISKLLRKEFGFEGLVLTDDLEMGAILKNYGIGEACKMAIKAGEDMLSICADQEMIREGFNAVLNAVKNGEISESRIDKSLVRIFKAKELIKQNSNLDLAELEEISAEIAELNKELNYNYGG